MSTTAVSALPVTLKDIIAFQAECKRHQQFQLLGQLDFAITTKGRMDFGKIGPKIGRDPLGGLLVLSPWMGLPAIISSSQTICDKCATKCPDCKGKGERLCTVCGGSGEVANGRVACECVAKQQRAAARKKVEVTIRPDPECKKCGGRGDLPKLVACKGCEEGQAKCYPCQGTGKRRVPVDAHGNPTRNCDACKNRGYKVSEQAQPLEKFVNGQLPIEGAQPLICLGPVKKLVWHTVGGTGGEQPRFVECTILPDAQQNLMVIALDRRDAGANAYLLGGVPSY